MEKKNYFWWWYLKQFTVKSQLIHLHLIYQPLNMCTDLNVHAKFTCRYVYVCKCAYMHISHNITALASPSNTPPPNIPTIGTNPSCTLQLCFFWPFSLPHSCCVNGKAVFWSIKTYIFKELNSFAFFTQDE